MSEITGTVQTQEPQAARGYLLDVEARAEAVLASRPVEVHPAWCQSADLFTTNGFSVPCGNHLGEPLCIPATDSDFVVCDQGLLFPYVEVAPATKDDELAVSVMVFQPRAKNDQGREWAATSLRPADARKLADDLGRVGRCAVVADLSSFEMTAAATGLDGGTVQAVTDGGSVRVTVTNGEGLAIEAFLKPSEVDLMTLNLVKAADVVEGR